LTFGLQAKCRNDIAQFNEPVVFISLIGGQLSFVGLPGERLEPRLCRFRALKRAQGAHALGIEALRRRFE
jgi:hypothetical protein